MTSSGDIPAYTASGVIDSMQKRTPTIQHRAKKFIGLGVFDFGIMSLIINTYTN
jgi:hypothetical protein